jgi:hypothetical protein
MIFCKSFENKVKMSPSPPLETYKIPLKSSLSSSCKSGRGEFCSCRNCYSKTNNNNVIDAKYERREDDNPIGGGGGAGRRRRDAHDKDNDFRKNTTSPFDDFESGLMRQHSERYRKSTERPHHHQKQQQQQQFVDDRFERSHHRRQIEDHHNHQKSNKKMIENVRNNGNNKFSDRNPYREPDNLFYHESVENMLKSPLLNNYTNRKQYHGNADGGVNDEQYRVRRKQQQQQSHYHETAATRKSTHSAPESSLRKSSPKERFLNAKEKFQAIAEQRNRYADMQKDHRQVATPEKCPSDCSLDDNSCEDSDCSKRNELSFYRQSHLTKSLGNLNRGGYRHSVALPDMNYKYCNRVGLAAIDY